MKIAAFVPFDEESICYGLIDGENIREINDPFTGEEIKERGKVYKRADVILVNPTFPVKALCIGLNSDASVRRNKGPTRPIVDEQNRAKLLACLRFVDYVVLFDEDEPKTLIGKILPDVLVKGKDWAHYVSGREIVEANGGRVVLADMVAGLSTTHIIGKILATTAR